MKYLTFIFFVSIVSSCKSQFTLKKEPEVKRQKFCKKLENTVFAPIPENKIPNDGVWIIAEYPFGCDAENWA